MNPRFADQVVIVTGASQGIGQATAVAFARERAKVVVNYLSNDAGARATIARIQGDGGRAWSMPVDVSQPAGVERMVETIEREIGPIRVLVNNAAAFNRQPFLEMPLDEFDRVLGTNIRGLFYLSQVVARHMAARRQGSIVNISSIGARQAVEARSAYCASKGAVESLTRAMALDLARYTIRVNAVAPGMVRSEGLLASLPDPARQAALEAYVPDGRFGDPEEIANVILFVASEEARYINGALIPVDGSLSAREAGFPRSSPSTSGDKTNGTN